MKPLWSVLLFIAIFIFPPGAQAQLNIHVSILPQQYFVQQIAQDLARVSVLVKPGKSPATYAPTPTQIKALSRSDIYFRIGVPFENGFLHKIETIAQNVKVVDTRRGVPLREMEIHRHHEDHGDHHGEEDHGQDHHGEEDHGQDHHGEADEDGHDDHDGKDPHIWMAPPLVKRQAQTILSALVEAAPEHRDAFQRNHDLFIQELDRLHLELKALLEPCKGKQLFVFHPSFGYFTDTYGLEQVAVETMGKAPKGKALSHIIKWIKKEKARVIFVQPQFDTHTAHNIAAAIQGVVVSIDPLAYDYPENMRTMAQVISRNLTP